MARHCEGGYAARGNPIWLCYAVPRRFSSIFSMGITVFSIESTWKIRGIATPAYAGSQ
jgi:hypothetical protein